MAEFILRVDDCGWTPDKQDDRGLEYFRRWRDTFGIAGCPVYYGFIPVTLGVRELDWLLTNLTREECIAQHGYSHERGEDLALGDHDNSRLGRGARILSLGGFDFQSYIAPFNDYKMDLVERWSCLSYDYWGVICRQPGVFFGGFPDDPQSIDLGPFPTLVRSVVHLPAYRPLYGRVGELLDRVDKHLDIPYPVVVTLHATWDANELYLLPHLLEKLRPHLRHTSAVRDWLKARGAQLV